MAGSGQSKPKLIFVETNGPGRGELIRLVLKLGKIDFDTECLSESEFNKRKESGDFPFDRLPVMELGNSRLGQSMPIIGYLAIKSKLSYDDLWTEAKVWEMMNAICEISHLVFPLNKDDLNESLDDFRARIARDSLPHYLSLLDRQAANNKKEFGGTGFLVGNKMTVADLSLFVLNCWFENGIISQAPKDLVSKYSNLGKSIDLVKQNPNVKKISQEIYGTMAA